MTTPVYLIPVEITATVADPDLFADIVRTILAEGLAQYHELGDLAPFERLAVFISPTIELDDEQLAQRAKREERLRTFWKMLEYVAHPEPDEPAKQLAMPGL